MSAAAHIPPECAIRELPVALAYGQFKVRTLWATQRFFDWLPLIAAVKKTDASLQSYSEQILGWAKNFVGGGRIMSPREFELIRPSPRSVLEIRTAELRIFGWVPRYDEFVACCGDTYYNTHASTQANAYEAGAKFVEQVRRVNAWPLVGHGDLNRNFSNVWPS